MTRGLKYASRREQEKGKAQIGQAVMGTGEAKKKGRADWTWVLPFSARMTFGRSLKPLESTSSSIQAGIYHTFLRILLRLTKIYPFLPPFLPSLFLPTYISAYSPIYLPVYLSISLIFCLATYLIICLSISLYIHINICLSHGQSTSPFPDFLSILLLSVYLTIYLI